MSKLFSYKRITAALFLFSVTMFMLFALTRPCTAKAGSLSFVILDKYSVSMNIGETTQLFSLTSSGKKPTFKSSRSSVASVSTHGKITAKSPGTAIITAKIRNAEACCKIKVNKTKITLGSASMILERGEKIRLTAKTSSGSDVTYKSSKKSVALVSGDGTITAVKPGEAYITVKADSSTAICKVTVKKPDISLDYTNLTLYRHGRRRILAHVSSRIRPKWKSSNSSVATVTEFGVITARKHGKATITASLDGVSAHCYVTVQSPVITLGKTSVNLKVGQKQTLRADVSSFNKPVFKSSNSKIAKVDENGQITACKAGKAYITVSEDGTSVRCKVTVAK